MVKFLKTENKVLTFYKWFLIIWIPFDILVIISAFSQWGSLSRLYALCVGICLTSLPYHIRDLRTTRRNISDNKQKIKIMEESNDH